MFTAEELDILMEALDVWEKEPTSSAAFAGFVSAMFADPENREDTLHEALEDPKRQVAIRKRRVIRLKAKLLDIADESLTSQLFVAGNLTNPAE